MATTYFYNVFEVVDIPTKVIALDATLNADQELSGIYTATIYNAVTFKIEVTFSTALTTQQHEALGIMVNIEFYSNPNNIIHFADIYKRKVYEASFTPSATADADKGYNPGSIITTAAGAVYICVDSTAGAAVWDRIDNMGGNDYGVMRLSAPQPTGATYTVTFTQNRVDDTFDTLDNATNVVAGNLNNVTFTAASGANGPRLTVANTGVYFISYCVSVQADGSNDDMIHAIFANGTIVNDTLTTFNSRRSDRYATITGTSAPSLTAGDVLDLRVRIDNGTATLVYAYFNVYVEQIA